MSVTRRASERAATNERQATSMCYIKRLPLSSPLCIQPIANLRCDATHVQRVPKVPCCLPAACFCLAACLAACLPVCLPAYLPVCLPAYLPACLPACLLACLPLPVFAWLPASSLTLLRNPVCPRERTALLCAGI